MRGQDLLDALEYVKPELIEDAGKAPTRKRARWIGLVAAVLLVLGIGTMGTYYLGSGQFTPNGSEPAGIAQPEPEQESLLEDKEQQAETSTAPETDESPSEVREQLLSMTLGGLRLGMPEAEVKAIMGEPDEVSNSVAITDADGNTRISWFYKSSGDSDTRHDVNLGMIDTGDGWILNEINAFSSSDFALSNGIRIGSTLEEVDAVCGSDYVVTQEDPERIYELGENQLYLQILLSDDIVTCISLGVYIAEDIDWESMESADSPYSFSGDPITVYQRTESGWTVSERTGKDAKLVEATMGIEELLPYDGENKDTSYVVDFHNGTVAVLYGSDESGAVYTTEDFAPEILDTENWEKKLSLYTECYFPMGTWNAVTGN